jgi:hypothetical protein
MKSKYIGVTWKKQNKKWRAQIKTNNYPEHIGYFDTETEAAIAYKEKLEYYKKLGLR